MLIAAYYDLFSHWFGNVFFITGAFLLCAGVVVLAVVSIKRGLRRHGVTTAVMAIVCYLMSGLLIAPGRWGGQAEFLYDPSNIGENMIERGGLAYILTWPRALLPTGGIYAVVFIAFIAIIFLFIRRTNRSSA